MPFYEHQGVVYDIDTTDPREAQQKINKHLGKGGMPLDLPPRQDEGSFLQPSEMLPAAAGGLEAAAGMVSQIPQAIWKGYSGLGAAMTGGNIGSAMDRAEQQVPAYTPQSKYGQLAGQGLGELTEQAGYLAGDNPALQSADEAAANISQMLLPLGPKARVPKDVAAGNAWVGGKKAIDAAKAAEVQKNAEWAGKGVEEGQPQAELPMDMPPATEPLPRPDLNEYAARAQERFDEDAPYRELQKNIIEPQADLFADPRPESFPGVERSQELQREAEGLKMEHTTESPTNLSSSSQMEPFRQGDMDFPLRQEAIDKDPYLQTLREEAQKAYDEHERLVQWTKQYNKSPESIIKRMDENAKRTQEVHQLAAEYLKNAYRVSTPDGYSGSMWLDKPKQMTIEKTKTYRVGRTKQEGAIDVEAVKKAIEALDKRIKNLEISKDNLLPAARDAAEKRLEKLYYEQMKNHRALEAMSNPKHPLHDYYKNNDPFKGPGKKQAGAINLEGFDFGGFAALPKHLKYWIQIVAQHRALEKLHETGGLDKKGMPLREAEAEYQRLIQSDLDNPTFVKQALAHSVSGMAPDFVHKMGVKGNIGKQEGAIKFGDPEFTKFKSELPLPLRKDARRLYNEYKKSQPKRDQSVFENEKEVGVIKNIPGLRDWKDEVAPIPVDPAKVKELILQNDDLGSGRRAAMGRQMVSGGKMLGFGTQNPLVRFVTQQMDGALRKAQRAIEDLILDKNTGFKPKWEKLDKESFGTVWHDLILEEGKKDLSRDELFAKGYSEKMVDAAMSLRDALTATYDRLNSVRVSLGKKPIDYRQGYIPSRFRGDFVFDVKDSEGNVVHKVGANTKEGAKRLQDYFRENHPDLIMADIKHEPLHRFKDASDVTAGYQALLEVLSEDDPRVKALEATYGDFLKRQSYEAMSVRKHFWNKKDTAVGGFEGGKVWEDAHTNAAEGLRSIMNYMDHAHKWAEAKEALEPVTQVLKDQEIQQKVPQAVKWAQGYIDQALGRSTKLARGIDTISDALANTTGIGQSLQLKTIREIKDWMTSLYLGFWNVGFSISQLVQVTQTIPAWMMMLKNKGAEGSIIAAYGKGMVDAVKYFGPNRLADTLPSFIQDAMVHADKYAVIAPHILDEVRTNTGRNIKAWEEWIRTKNMTLFEEKSRTIAYLTWVHFLNDSGRFKGRELYETAANLTDMTMVDYRAHERAMMYKQLGLAGEMSNALTTYKHNFYSQIWALNAHRKGLPNKEGVPTSVSGGLSPLGALATTGLLLSGLLGLPGREDIDALIHFYNRVAPNFTSTRIPTTRELVLKFPDYVAFGGASAITGWDFSGKFSTANIMPDSPLSFLQPFAGGLGDIAGNLGQFAASPSTTSGMRAGAGIAPGPLKAPFERYFTQRDGQGRNMFIDPQTMEGRHVRTDADEKARLLALRSPSEVRDMNTGRALKDQEHFNIERRKVLLKDASDIMYGQPDSPARTQHLAALGMKYMEAEGDARSFVKEIVSKVEKQNQTPMERALLGAMRNPMRLKRVEGQR